MRIQTFRTFAILIFTTLLSFSVMAKNNSQSNIKMGSVNKDNLSAKLYFGADFMVPSDSFSIGIGFDNVGLYGGNGATNTYGNYTLGGQVKLGYSFKSLINYPIVIKADVGYGVTQYYKNNYYGTQYGINLEGKLYKLLGAGVGYKSIDTGTELGTTNNVLIYLSLRL